MEDPKPSLTEDSGPFVDCALISNHKIYEANDFPTEKGLCDFLHERAPILAKEILGINYQGHEREFIISGDSRVNKSSKGRVDFMFKDGDGCILVECKKPTHCYSESVNAISQLLAYSCLSDQYNLNYQRLVLMTTRFNPMLKEVIKKFNLPVEVYIVSKDHVMKLIMR